MIFLGGSDGIVRAIDAENGRPRWTTYTGGAVRIAPTVNDGRVFVGSGDSWVYSFEALTGRLLWRFRAAPLERMIPVYGSLLSTWAAASGVLVENGTAYVAAGIVNYDRTFVYALDAATGEVRWENNTSGHLDPEARTGVSVQGHMLLHNNKLYLAGGIAVSPAVYDIRDGRCLNDPAPLKKCEAAAPRGRELYLIGDHVKACRKPYYRHPDFPVYDSAVSNMLLITSAGNRDIVWLNKQKIMCLPHIDREQLNRCVANPTEQSWSQKVWGTFDIPSKPFWDRECTGSLALTVCKNAVVYAGGTDITALNFEEGEILLEHALAATPVPWGLAVDRDGCAIVALNNGQILCFGAK